MVQPVVQRIGHGGIHVIDATRLSWQATAQPGLQLLPIRQDDERGLFLGAVRFAPFTRSGVHQHQGVATSFVIDGGLTDQQGHVGLHVAGINQKGSTHEAVSCQSTVLISRLEAPVSYLPQQGDLSGLHAGSHHAEFVNPAPDVPCDLNVAVDGLARLETGVRAVRRQTIFDYSGTGDVRRHLQLQIEPQSTVPTFEATALTELWVRGGVLEIEHEGQKHTARAHSFVVIEPGARVTWRSSFGALLLVWAEGRESWVDAPQPRGAVEVNLFGF
jgi:quercetin dioxygenase-like cupin family protein